MRKILILTKNVLSEQHIQKKLQHLNYEVFCSTEIIQHMLKLKSSDLFTDFFQVIVFSETITNEEVELLLPLFLQKDLLIYRKAEEEPSAINIEAWQSNGINDWLPVQITMDGLREKLQKGRPGRRIQSRPVLLETSKDLFEAYHHYDKLTNIVFSKIENQVLEQLCFANGKIVSRDDLCESIWQEETTSSHLSYLSLIVKKIKKKLTAAGISEESIQTIWGEGYRASLDLCKDFQRKYMVVAKEV